MNLGQAAAVCLYELIRGGRAAAPLRRTPAAAAEVDRITAGLLDVLHASGYIHDKSAELKIRRLVRRMDMAAGDAEVWLGMVRQIRWKLGL